MTCPDLSSSLVSIGYAVRTNQQEGAAQRSNDTNSATTGESAHGGEMRGLRHGKLGRMPASGWLHRMVRPQWCGFIG